MSKCLHHARRNIVDWVHEGICAPTTFSRDRARLLHGRTVRLRDSVISATGTSQADAHT